MSKVILPYYAVHPSKQWLKEYPHQDKILYWQHKRHAYESAYDTDGAVVVMRDPPPTDRVVREF